MIKLGNLAQLFFFLSLPMMVCSLFSTDWNSFQHFAVITLVCGLLLVHWRMWPFSRRTRELRVGKAKRGEQKAEELEETKDQEEADVYSRPTILDHLFNDDRVYVLEISGTTTSSDLVDEARSAVEIGQAGGRPGKRGWSVITRRNIDGYPPWKVNEFQTAAEAVDYYEKVVVSTPRASLGEKSPYPAPTLDEYRSWVIAEKIFDPVLNPAAPRRRSRTSGV